MCLWMLSGVKVYESNFIYKVDLKDFSGKLLVDGETYSPDGEFKTQKIEPNERIIGLYGAYDRKSESVRIS